MSLVIKKESETVQIKQLNDLIEKENKEIGQFEQKIEQQREKCRDKQQKLAVLKLSLDIDKK